MHESAKLSAKYSQAYADRSM